MHKASMTINREFAIAQTSPNLYSSFVEHIGRVVYTGIYDPGNPLSDKDGFREDVLEAVRGLNFSLVRYPGGNFVSGYHWEDGVGPRCQRPRTPDLAWFVTETNQFGTNDFMDWSKKAGVSPIMTVNLGTRGVEDARNLIEYCNLPGGTRYSDLRVKHGYKEPHAIQYWCLGNEMDGPWQIGQKTGDEYGRLACETAKVMKWVDPNIKLVLSGSSNRSMPTYPQYSATALEHCYEHVDYLALHQYYQNAVENDAANFLAKTLSLDAYIHSSVALCDYVKEKKRSSKTINICFDEYNVCNFGVKMYPYDRWTDKPVRIGEEPENIYNIEDALMVGNILLTFLKHADRIHISCLAQLVNATGPIITGPNGIYKQTIYYVLEHLSRWGRGTVLLSPVNCGKYDSAEYTDVPLLDAVAVQNDELDEITVFAINRSITEESLFTMKLTGATKWRFVEHIVYAHNEDHRQKNTFADSSIVPVTVADVNVDGQQAEVCLLPFSWNVIRFKKA